METPNCPIDCPNRKREQDTLKGKIAAYSLALIGTMVLTFECVSADRRNEPISPILAATCLGIIGGALGVNVDVAAIGNLISQK